MTIHESNFNLRSKIIINLFLNYQLNSYTKILDVGCNNGNLSKSLKNELNAKYIYGIDFDEKNLNLAKEKGIKTIFLNIDKNKLPFKDNYFNGIFAGDIIEHLIDVDNFFKELYRILKPDGTLIISTPNLACWYNRIVLLFGYQPFWTDMSNKNPNAGKLLKMGLTEGGQHLRIFTPKSLKETAEAYKFKIIKSNTPYIGFGYTKYKINILEKFMCYLGLGSSQFIILSK